MAVKCCIHEEIWQLLQRPIDWRHCRLCARSL